MSQMTQIGEKKSATSYPQGKPTEWIYVICELISAIRRFRQTPVHYYVGNYPPSPHADSGVSRGCCAMLNYRTELCTCACVKVQAGILSMIVYLATSCSHS